jgi:uncharacterized protein GlcG (DUF336 family)
MGQIMNERANDNVSWFAKVSTAFATRPGVALIAIVDLLAVIVAIMLGAVGVSGDTSDNDEICAIAGIEAAGLKANAG